MNLTFFQRLVANLAERVIARWPVVHDNVILNILPNTSAERVRLQIVDKPTQRTFAVVLLNGRQVEQFGTLLMDARKTLPDWKPPPSPPQKTKTRTKAKAEA